MGCGPPTKYRLTHDEAWRYLLHVLRPDVAFVQEALSKNAVTEGGSLIWSDVGGTAIFVRRGISCNVEHVRSEGAYFSAVRSSIGGESVLLGSIHVSPGNYKKHLIRLAATLKPLGDSEFLGASGSREVPVRPYIL